MTEAIFESLILLLDAYASCLEGNGMEETRYGLKVLIPVSNDEAVVRATDALKAQGFGVLTSIDDVLQPIPTASENQNTMF